MPAVHVVTPVWESPALSAALGAPVLLKMEALQPVGSFKARAMGAVCQARWAAGARQVVCASGGNAGYAVAYASRKLGMAATIVAAGAHRLAARPGPHPRRRRRHPGARRFV